MPYIVKADFIKVKRFGLQGLTHLLLIRGNLCAPNVGEGTV